MGRLTKRNHDGSVGISELRHYNYDDFQKLAQKLAHYEDLEEQGLLQYPKPELNDCGKCGSLGEFGGCLFFGYGKDTEEQCRKRMAKLKELKEGVE